ncbi:hypothetical protein LY78DRAFT_643101 [Colletotrichum sublineola]|nr:hypothetical protein LY78DRAFT_643101 [Colletotrichum sublineola]
MSSDLESKILQAAARNRELLAVLAETDNAIPDLTQQRRLIADLDRQLQQSDKTLGALEARRKKELKDHEKYRDSVMRRFVHKAVGKRDKFDERAAREEREYFDVLQQEHREKEVNGNLRAQLAAAREAAGPLEAAARRHDEAQCALDTLYDAIFAGPTPAYPDDDRLERDAEEARRAYHDTRSMAEAEQHAIRLLTAAAGRMGDALRGMDDALSHSRMDMFGGGGTMTDMMERSALQRAEAAVQEARGLVAQAGRMTPHVGGPLPPVAINHGGLVGDVLFDNVFTDMAFHDEIKKSRLSVERCAAALGGILRETRARHQELTWRLKAQGPRLESTRTALQKEREKVFERIAGEGHVDAQGTAAAAAAAAATSSVSTAMSAEVKQ